MNIMKNPHKEQLIDALKHLEPAEVISMMKQVYPYIKISCEPNGECLE